MITFSITVWYWWGKINKYFTPASQYCIWIKQPLLLLFYPNSSYSSQGELGSTEDLIESDWRIKEKIFPKDQYELGADVWSNLRVRFFSIGLLEIWSPFHAAEWKFLGAEHLWGKILTFYGSDVSYYACSIWDNMK